MTVPKEHEFTWANVIVRASLSAVTHPFEYAKTLIQMGHEPLPLYKSKTFFGTEALFYPNIFSYMRHIKRTDGFVGCYSGLVPKIGANIVCGVTFHKVLEYIPVPENETKEPEEMNEDERTKLFIERTARESAAKTVAIIVSQPLQVIAIRTMAEFVGHDGVYTGITSSIGVIFKENGIAGFFAGLVPRVMCEIGGLLLSNALIHIIDNYIVEDKDLKPYIFACVRFLSAAVMYPLHVVSVTLSVTNSGITAGSPPCMPHYDNWLECFSHLSSLNAQKRGSSVLWRRFNGPTLGLSKMH